MLTNVDQSFSSTIAESVTKPCFQLQALLWQHQYLTSAKSTKFDIVKSFQDRLSCFLRYLRSLYEMPI